MVSLGLLIFILLVSPSPEDTFVLVLERGRGRNIDVSEEHHWVASCMHPDQAQNSKYFF